MIHRQSRDALALAIRRYVSGRITNDDLDDIAVDWRDRGAAAVKEMAWNLYDDNDNHRAVGKHHLNKSVRREIARWIVFLHSDQEYIWPEYSFIQIWNWPANLLTFGWWERWKSRRLQAFKEAGDFSVWPFTRRADFVEVVLRPRLLSGREV